MKKLIALTLALTATPALADEAPIRLYKDYVYGMKESEAPQITGKVSITPNCQAEVMPEWTKVWKVPGLPDLTEETYLEPDGKKVRRLTALKLNVTLCDYDELKALLRQKYGEPTDTVRNPFAVREQLVWYAGNVKVSFNSYVATTISYEPFYGTDAL